jgi:hypothetical protein
MELTEFGSAHKVQVASQFQRMADSTYMPASPSYSYVQLIDEVLLDHQ